MPPKKAGRWGGVGAHSLNIELRAALNPTGESEVARFGSSFAPGDKVIQIENVYDKEVYNGDIGQVEGANLIKGELMASFDGRTVTVPLRRTRHAGSGLRGDDSQKPGLGIPRCRHSGSDPAYAMVQRNVVDTGITRGKRLVVIVGQRKAVAIAVRCWPHCSSGRQVCCEPAQDRGGSICSRQRQTRTARRPLGRTGRRGAPVVLLNLKAGGPGLTLTEADTVIFYGSWWNPAVERQAMNRAHRIGQDNPVFVHRLVAAGSVCPADRLSASSRTKEQEYEAISGVGEPVHCRLLLTGSRLASLGSALTSR